MNVVRIEARPPASATAAERARKLLLESRAAAVEHVEALEAAIKVVRELCSGVLDGGDAYSVGVRDLAAQLAEDLLWRGKRLEALIARERAGPLAH
jgi:hypothetical protein